VTRFGGRVRITYWRLASARLLDTLSTGAACPKLQAFDKIKVQRIDVVEPDGTIRTVISDRHRLLLGGPSSKLGAPANENNYLPNL
jgi:hypothetical protein